MLHGIEVLAVRPMSFLRRFRSEEFLLIYDSSFGIDNGRIISEVEAVEVVSGYNLLFGRMERLVNCSAKVFILSLFVPFAAMAITKPSIGLYLFEVIVATMVGIIIFANFRLWQFRRAVWQSVERGISAERLSSSARIQHGYRMDWRSRINTGFIVLIVGPIYLYAHIGADSKVISLFRIGQAGKTYHKIFLIAIFAIFMCFIMAAVIHKHFRKRRQQQDELTE